MKIPSLLNMTNLIFLGSLSIVGVTLFTADEVLLSRSFSKSERPIQDGLKDRKSVV